MKQTAQLDIVVSFVKKDRVVIHPNDGFDIGLIALSNPVKMFMNCNDGQFLESTVDHSIVDLSLLNECKPGTIQMHKTIWEKLGKPPKIVVKYHDGKIMLVK